VAEATAVARSLLEQQGDLDQIEMLTESGLSDSDASKLMATTAIVFAVGAQPTAEGVPYALAVAAGDSSAFLLSSLQWQSLTDIKNLDTEIASSSVRPLPSRRTVTSQSGLLQPGDALVVMTDGVGDPLGSGLGVVGRFLAQCWNLPCDPLAFGSQVGFIRKTFVDDRTAFTIWHVPQ
jgi:hypothetical protein